MQIFEIHIRLLNEGTDVWRPVKAEQIGNSLFKIISQNESQGDEIWEHNIGDIVQCQTVYENGQAYLKAVSKDQG